MKNDNDSSEKTSRRQFTKAIVTAAVAAPIVATIACNKPSVEKTDCPKCPVVAKPGTGYTEIDFTPPLVPFDHIPPMGIDGGGSLVIDSRNKLIASSAGGTHTYKEDPSEHTGADPNKNRYGEIEGLFVITESADKPFLGIKHYTNIGAGAELQIWYQDLTNGNPNPTPSDPDETNFDPLTGPRVTIKGGKSGRLFQMTVDTKKFDEEKSHKTNRKHRYKHGGGWGAGKKHFRIGKWAIVNGTATIVSGEGDDRYSLYLEFRHFS